MMASENFKMFVDTNEANLVPPCIVNCSKYEINDLYYEKAGSHPIKRKNPSRHCLFRVYENEVTKFNIVEKTKLVTQHIYI